MRKAFNFYRSYWEQIKLLSPTQKIDIMYAVCKVQFLEKHIDDVRFEDPISELVWTGMKHSIQGSIDGYVNKQKGLGNPINIPTRSPELPPYQAPYQPPYQQEEEKGEEEVKEEVKEEEEKKKPLKKKVRVIILPFESDKFYNAWEMWKEYKSTEHSFRYKSDISEQSALRKLSNLAKGIEQEAILILEDAMANGYKGFFKLNNSNNGQKHTSDTSEHVKNLIRKIYDK